MKHLKYLRYLLIHKWWVFVAGVIVKAPVHRLLIHDWSKFLPCEYLPYAEFFYGWVSKNRGTERAKPEIEKFHKAWLHHLHWNRHHWQHWVLQEDEGGTRILEIPEKYVREMVADWCGAGRAITGGWDMDIWYYKNKGKIKLHPETRILVEKLIKEFKEYIICARRLNARYNYNKNI